MRLNRFAPVLLFSVTAVAVLYAQSVSRDEAGSGEAAQRRTLAGLNGVEVVVESMDPKTERAGLTRKALQTDVELRLRKAGIRVLSDEERSAMPGYQYLYVRVSTLVHDEHNMVLFNIEVQLVQSVALVRDPKQSLLAPTWETRGVFGAVSTGRIRNLRDDVADGVDEFINAYLAANPKKP